MSWGLPPGVVLIGDAQLARPECASAVMAHELAHIRRRDWLFLLLSRSALALFWFNPMVWWLHAELAARTEDAADAEALKVLDPGAYARTLIGLAAEFGQPAVLTEEEAAELTETIDRTAQASVAEFLPVGEELVQRLGIDDRAGQDVDTAR